MLLSADPGLLRGEPRALKTAAKPITILSNALAARSRKRQGNRPSGYVTQSHPAASRISSPCLGLFGEKARQPFAHRVSFCRGPFPKALAGFHTELAGLDLVAQERVRPCGAVKIAIKHLRDVEGEVQADPVGLLHGPKHGGARTEPSRTTVSMVSASQTPVATSATASRFIACCSRLPTNPGMS